MRFLQVYQLGSGGTKLTAVMDSLVTTNQSILARSGAVVTSTTVQGD